MAVLIGFGCLADEIPLWLVGLAIVCDTILIATGKEHL